MDVHTKEQRSYNMSRVKSKNTKPEKMVFSLLKERGISFNKHYHLYGKPDIVLKDVKIAIFIDGEFWHGKNFSKWKLKLSDFWQKKISVNISRDRRCNRLLRREGWHIIHLWGKKISKSPEKAILRIERFIMKIGPS